MNNKKMIIIISIVVIAIPLLLLVFIKGKDIYEISKLKKEISTTIKNIDNNTVNLEEIEKDFKTNLTTGNNLIIEEAVEAYLVDISKNIVEINKIEASISSISILELSGIEILDKNKTNIQNINASIESINEDKYITDRTKNNGIINKYKKIISNKINLDKYKTKIDNISNTIDVVREVIDFLIVNKSNYKIEDNSIIFLKRKAFEEYKTIMAKITEEISVNLFDYKLIDDTEGPIIEANSVNIIKGTNYVFLNHVKCVDSIDDEVECVIGGSYDVNTIGSYKMKITAKDKSGNTTTKEVTINVKEPEKPTGPYYTEVIRNQNTVIVYGLDDNGEYTKIVKVFPCSVGSGNNTPIGTFKTTKGLVWGSLFGGVYGQYSTRIVGSVLFHSVPYYAMDKSTLWWQEYNNLGTARSMGCIRLTVRDAKWLYDNCPPGMTVKIYDGQLPSGVSKPSAQKIDGNSPNRGWDPTDPDPNNPWNS